MQGHLWPEQHRQPDRRHDGGRAQRHLRQHAAGHLLRQRRQQHDLGQLRRHQCRRHRRCHRHGHEHCAVRHLPDQRFQRQHHRRHERWRAQRDLGQQPLRLRGPRRTSQNNLLQGNYIGTDASGLVALGNTNGGASFWGAGTGNVFGGGGGRRGQRDLRQLRRGVLVGNGSTGATIQGNMIGVGADGVDARRQRRVRHHGRRWVDRHDDRWRDRRRAQHRQRQCIRRRHFRQRHQRRSGARQLHRYRCAGHAGQGQRQQRSGHLEHGDEQHDRRLGGRRRQPDFGQRRRRHHDRRHRHHRQHRARKSDRLQRRSHRRDRQRCAGRVGWTGSTVEHRWRHGSGGWQRHRWQRRRGHPVVRCRHQSQRRARQHPRHQCRRHDGRDNGAVSRSPERRRTTPLAARPANAGNRITNSTAYGIGVERHGHGQRDSSRNPIYGNGGLGIDLGNERRDGQRRRRRRHRRQQPAELPGDRHGDAPPARRSRSPAR